MTLTPTSSRGGGGSASANTLLSNTVLGADGSFDISGISAAYNDLLVVVIVRCTSAATGETIGFRLNNDSGANYYSQAAVGNNTTAFGEVSVATTLGRFGRAPAATAPASHFGGATVTLFGYASTTWFKVWAGSCNDSEGTAAANQNAYYYTGRWANTAAVSRLQVFGGTTNNFLSGSSLRIYGVT